MHNQQNPIQGSNIIETEATDRAADTKQTMKENIKIPMIDLLKYKGKMIWNQSKNIQNGFFFYRSRIMFRSYSTNGQPLLIIMIS